MNMFNGFSLYAARDPSNGYVRYVDLKEANSTGLVSYTPREKDLPGLPVAQGQDANDIILAVDSKNKYPPINAEQPGRPSVRLESNMLFDEGLFIADIQHSKFPTYVH